MNDESQWIYTEAIAFIIFTPVHNLHAWSVDGESDCRDSLLTNSMQTYGR